MPNPGAMYDLSDALVPESSLGSTYGEDTSGFGVSCFLGMQWTP